MAVRIFNKLAPAEEGILCKSFAAAEDKLKGMLNQFKARGFRIVETNENEGVLYSVFDENGQPVGIYYIE